MKSNNRFFGQMAQYIAKKIPIKSAPHAQSEYKWRKTYKHDPTREEFRRVFDAHGLTAFDKLNGVGVYGWVNNSDQVSPEEIKYEILYDTDGNEIGASFI